LQTSLFPSLKKELAQFEEILAIDLISPKHSLSEVLKPILFSNGKRLRPALTLAIGALTSPEKTVKPDHFTLAKLTEMIHTATLVHDDVIDDSAIRRGEQSMHSRLGHKIAVIAGDFLFAEASVLLGELSNEKISKIYAHALSGLCRGEIEQWQRRGDLEAVDLESYLQKSSYKTAILFSAAIESATLINTDSEQESQYMSEFGRCLGLAFQIIDDLLDFTRESSDLGKPSLNDIQQGIFTAPVLIGLQDSGISDELKDLIEQKKFPEVKLLLEDNSCFQKTKDLARQYTSKALSLLSKFPESPYQKDLHDFMEYMVERGS